MDNGGVQPGVKFAIEFLVYDWFLFKSLNFLHVVNTQYSKGLIQIHMSNIEFIK